MNRDAWLLFLVPALISAAPDCSVPPGAVTKLKAYLSYQSSVGLRSPGEQKFSFAA